MVEDGKGEKNEKSELSSWWKNERSERRMWKQKTVFKGYCISIRDDKEEKKSNIEIITSMINPKEWFEDITKRAKILREKYFKGKEGEKENKD